MHKLSIALALGLACALPVHAQSPAELFVGINSGNTQSQGVALLLANQAVAQKAQVRILLCSEGGQLALRDKESSALKPVNKSPKEILQGLIKAGAKVEVCAIFLPNSDWKATDLIEGVVVAKPADVTAYLLQANVKTLTY